MHLADGLTAYLKGEASPYTESLEAEHGPERLMARPFKLAYPAGWLYQDKVWIYRFYQRHAEISKSLRARRESEQQWHAELRRASDPLLLVLVVPRLKEVFSDQAEKAVFLHTAFQEALAACALERCRLAQGQYPDSLEALVPTFLKQVPLDIRGQSGARLQYRRTEDGGFVVYSVGLNGVDDGGQPSPASRDWRGTPQTFPQLQEGDWVWRISGSRL